MAHSDEITIRPIQAEELHLLIPLLAAHAAFEQLNFSYSQQEARLKQKIFEDEQPLYCLVAEHQGKLIGYATYLRQYATWEANYYVYLDCLYLDEAFRGRGLGKKLMEEVAVAAVGLGCKLIQWQTPTFNEAAIRFYHKIGATSKSKVRFFWEVS